MAGKKNGVQYVIMALLKKNAMKYALVYIPKNHCVLISHFQMIIYTSRMVNTQS